MIKKILTPITPLAALVFILTITTLLWLNITRQTSSYATGNGKYADQVDSFSEYIVRNSVTDRILKPEKNSSTLIMTEEHSTGDYNYYRDSTKKYYSNHGIQSFFYTSIARINTELFLQNKELYFQSFRYINCAFLVLCLFAFFKSYLGLNYLTLISIGIFSISSGAALFSSNLYFMAWLLFTPLFCYPMLESGKNNLFLLFSFLFSFLYFSVRYEFATTFALLWLFPFAALKLKNKHVSIKLCLTTFIIVCVGFILSTTTHHISVALEEGISITEASKLIFSSAQTRIASIQGVPCPFSYGFFKSILSRWSGPGFSLPLIFSISKLSLIFLVFILIYTRQQKNENILFFWAFTTYLSWYIAGYQHIMWHAQYDSLLFTSTIQLAIVLIFANISKIQTGKS